MKIFFMHNKCLLLLLFLLRDDKKKYRGGHKLLLPIVEWGELQVTYIMYREVYYAILDY